MVFTYSRYMRSAAEILIAPKETPRRPYHQHDITTLPPIVIDLILPSLTSTDLNALTNTSHSLRTLVRSRIAIYRQRSLEHIQSLSIAANLPNELLQEIFSYLGPLDFYNSTRVCSTWRGAGSYAGLVRKNVYAAQPTRTVSPPWHLDGQLKTLAFYLQRNGQLCHGIRAKGVRKAVSTLYCKNPGPASSFKSVFPNDSGYEPSLVWKPLPYPEIHLSEDGHYFLSAETVYPFRVHVYCTYRTVLFDNIKSCGGRMSFHPWDTTPTHLLTLPETGRVVSASFGKAMRGGVEFDRITGSYPKGIDLLVLFEAQRALLYKIRPTNNRTKSGSGIVKWTFGGRLFDWMTPAKPHAGQKSTSKWRIWDSMVFEGLCPLQQGPTKAKLGEWSDKVFFAGSGGLEVWKGVSDITMSTVSGEPCWDKGAAVRGLIPIISMPGKVSGIYTGKIWDSRVGADVGYIVCSNTIHGIPEELESENRHQKRSSVEALAALTLGRGTTEVVSEIACTTVITASESLVFNYTNFTQIPGPGAPQFLCLTPPYELSHLQLGSTLDTQRTLDTLIFPNWNTNASSSDSHKPLSLCKKSKLGFLSSAKITHIAAINIPSLSPSSPTTAVATDSGIIYVSTPQPYRASDTACVSRSSCQCSSRSNSFQRIALIPPDTGGRITDLKLSFRGPVWASPRRLHLHSEEAQPKLGFGGVLVVAVATDQGRIEMCYFNFCSEIEGNVLMKSEAGRMWDLSGKLVAPRVAGISNGDGKAKKAKAL